ncbi:MAG TPA: YdcF family protein [Dinghuibacter sp.]|jgi:hypothetical protein|uniref:YdcF family protein n=1 Tax=Dinghuibacter sp. TaxID=2024697 RepID=UPI002BD97154|nr:YdcF family protein [Dinghuibacter sp.]HTJ13286.1 YdcF family protein [Dinghuibacter sp.]
MRIFLVSFLLAMTTLPSVAQWDRQYKPTSSGSWIQDKDFYLFTLMEQPAVRQTLQKDPALQELLTERQNLVSQATGKHTTTPQVAVQKFTWTPEEIGKVDSALQRLDLKDLAREMRRSGYWIRYAGLPDTALLRTAWEDAARWLNRVIMNYTTNKGFRYAGIDSATFAPSSQVTTEALGETLMILWHHMDRVTVFFQPGLELALDILFINNRDEAGRFEPLDSTNREAYAKAGKTDWARFPYSAIVLPGEGPENDWAMSPVGKYRCQLGEEAYRAGKAPFIIVSGGFVHPFQTPYCEAVEMKDYLVHTLGIPDEAVILEPHARHTTTNIRNANRIMLRQGFPSDKRVLCVSTAGQAAYILAPFFAGRCKFEMGYVPFTDVKQEDPFSLSYKIEVNSLQMDGIDPLDP